MKKVLLLIVVLLFAIASAHSQNGRSPKETLTVNGVGLGATPSDITGKFGKPLKIKTEDAGECIGGRMRTMSYPGLTFVLYEDDTNKFTVGDFKVTGARWTVSGAKIGMTTASVKRLYGKADESQKDPESGSPVWFYHFSEDNPGNASFTFKNGKLIEIGTGFLMC